MLDRNFFPTSSRSKFYLYIHEVKTIFQRFFFTKDLVVNSSRYLSKDALWGSNFTKRDEKSSYINQNNRNIYLPPISCVALKQLFCNYKETFYVLVTIHTLFYLVVFIYQQFYVMFQFHVFYLVVFIYQQFYVMFQLTEVRLSLLFHLRVKHLYWLD